MPVSDMLRLGTASLTPQQIAEMALERDQESRRLMKAAALDPSLANLTGAFAALIERDKLAELFREQSL